MTYFYNSNNISNNNSLFNSYLTPGVKRLIIITAIVFGLQMIENIFLGYTNGLLMHFFALHPFCIFSNKFYIWQLLTAGFMHSPVDLFHIIFNMLTFYFFGHIVEQHLGTKRFVYFYLIAIVFASFAYSLCTILSVFLKFGWSVYSKAIEEGIDLYNAYSMLGASGAIMAVLVVASRIKPNTIVLIYFLFPIKLKNLIYVLIGIDLLSVINQNNNHIAVTAHLGGALFGFIYYYCYNRISFHSPNIKSYQHWKEQFKKNPQSFTQQPQENNVFSIYSQQYSQPNIQNELSQPDIQENKRPEKKQYPPEVIDALLDKIRRYGIASLTQEEREILQQISNNYSNR